MNRRDFLRNIGRGGLLAVLAGGTALLVGRRNNETCVNSGICRGCAEFSGCGLPQALSAKRAGVSEATWRTNAKE
ncbi:MAG: hypothetical protein ACYDCO_15530 [Armatimonadota bacterium]